MTCAFMDELADRLDEAAADDGLKAVAITAEGKAFSAGADVGEHHPDQAPKLIESFSRLFRILGGLEIPVVMGIDGAALGAGFELVQLADVLVASERAKFGQPEIRLAFFAPVGVAWLPALVGTARAMEITCSAESTPPRRCASSASCVRSSRRTRSRRRWRASSTTSARPAR
jgi:cyclohexa-1,5-dienecarbonyl-CoA hydratase